MGRMRRQRREGALKIETFDQARQIWDGTLIQASFISTVDDVD